MNRPHLRSSNYDNSGDVLPDGYKRLKDGTIIDTEDFKEGSNMMRDCKECIHSKIIIPKNPDCIPEAVCILSDEEFHDCLSSDKSRFEGNQLRESQNKELPSCNSCAHNGTWNCIKCSGFDRYEKG